jgi:hypothetical protein
MTLIELAVAGVLLGTLLVLCLQLLMATATLRKTVDQRQLAVCEVGNLMERLAARPWGQLTPQNAAAEKISAAARQRLPGAELKVELSEQPAAADVPPAKRIAVSLRWQDSAGRMLPPVTLTTWRYWKD